MSAERQLSQGAPNEADWHLITDYVSQVTASDVTTIPNEIALDEQEETQDVPDCLMQRVSRNGYTWQLFIGPIYPILDRGTIGDVWVTTLPGRENIYIRGEDNTWNSWHKNIDYAMRKGIKAEGKFLHSYHPWLTNRLLQFDGTNVGWHSRRLYYQHRSTWNSLHADEPAYESLTSTDVARYLALSFARRAVFFPQVRPARVASLSDVPSVERFGGAETGQWNASICGGNVSEVFY